MAEQKKHAHAGGKHSQVQSVAARGAVDQSPIGAGTSRVISSRGKKVIAAGIIMLALGFFILSKTDPQGQNWASMVSPFLIVGAYILIAVGIILPENK